MDRVTGEVGMVATAKETGYPVYAYDYALKCRPTQRVF
jgi:hypothetical protein